MRGWPLPRPTHAPATGLQNKQQQRSAPSALSASSVSFPSSERVKQSPTPLTPRAAAPAAACVAGRSRARERTPQAKKQTPTPRAISPEVARRRMTTPVVAPRSGFYPPNLRGVGETLEVKKIVVIPEFSAWPTLVLEQCRAENIRNLPRQRAPTPLFPERRPREACSMPISGCHDLPLATFNLPSRVFRHGCRRAEYPERRWGGFFHTLSRGQHMLPQQPSKQTATAPPLNLCRSQAPLGNASREAPLRIPAPAIAPRTNTAPAARRACLSIGIPGGFFHTLSSGGARRWENQEI